MTHLQQEVHDEIINLKQLIGITGTLNFTFSSDFYRINFDPRPRWSGICMYFQSIRFESECLVRMKIKEVRHQIDIYIPQ